MRSCGSSAAQTPAPTAPSAAAGDSDTQLPVTIEHAFGETSVEGRPGRKLVDRLR